MCGGDWVFDGGVGERIDIIRTHVETDASNLYLIHSKESRIHLMC